MRHRDAYPARISSLDSGAREITMKCARRISRMIAFVAGVSFALASPALAGPDREPMSREELSARPPAPGERALEGRLLAPCCWQGTLDAHESEPAAALRMQIRGRLYAGETVEAVEASLVRAYGERIRATPVHDPLPFVVGALVVVSALGALGVLRVLRRWRRAAAPATHAPSLAPATPDAYDARLDDELARLE
ncbi:MAG: cytochrome c-type biogenesis protein CcmH [Minicystis sp.]